MLSEYMRIYHLAVCTGCPFVWEIAGDKVCIKHKIDGYPQSIEDVDIETCERLSQPVNQLKMSNPKEGLGFTIELCEDGSGEAMVVLVGPSGTMVKEKLSELITHKRLVVLPSLRIFTKEGEDKTKQLREEILDRAFERAPMSATNPFSSMLDEEDE